jgi:hypothetical protein
MGDSGASGDTDDSGDSGDPHTQDGLTNAVIAI